MPKIWLFVQKGTEKVLFIKKDAIKKTAGHDEWWCPAVSFGLSNGFPLRSGFYLIGFQAFFAGYCRFFKGFLQSLLPYCNFSRKPCARFSNLWLFRIPIFYSRADCFCSCSFKDLRKIFPVVFFGSSSRNSISFGTLYLASRSLQ